MTKCTKDIERIFDCYCKRILKNCFIDYVRERKTYNNYNVSIESLSEREKLKLSYIPVFEIESKKYVVFNETIIIYNHSLVKALDELDEESLSVILLYYFLNLTDEEIAFILDLSRKTVNRKRNKLLKILRFNFVRFNNENI